MIFSAGRHFYDRGGVEAGQRAKPGLDISTPNRLFDRLETETSFRRRRRPTSWVEKEEAGERKVGEGNVASAKEKVSGRALQENESSPFDLLDA